MPRRDGTGPAGKGPKTGRGLGNCTPSTKVTVTTIPILGVGRGGRPRGGGRGRTFGGGRKGRS